MARTIIFNFAQGGGSTIVAGRLTLSGTQIYTSGETVVLPDEAVAEVVGGLASIPDVEPTPTGPNGWKYQVKVETYSGTVHRWIVEVPAGTTPIDFHLLPVIEATSLPIDATGTQLEVWFSSVRAQASAANSNATNALALIQQYHGGGGGSTPTYTTADTWEELRMIVMSNGTVKGIPVGDTPPGQPTIGSATPGSTMVRVLWTLLPQATNYKLFRNGYELFSGDDNAYTDRDVTDGQTYTYMLIAYDRHGQRSEASATVTAGPDAALNVAPTVDVATWPSPLPQSGTGIIRVTASDIEAQHLALTLNITTGTITPTRDPSIWIFTA